MTALVGPIDFHFGELLLEDYPELAVPRLCLRSNKKPMDDEGIVKLCAALDAAFALGRPMTILWDIRNVPIPSRKQLGIGLDWVGANAHLLDRHLQGIAIVLSSMLIRGVVNFVLHLTQPPQPNGCFADEQEAFAFARDRCTEVKAWKGSRKVSNRKRAERGATPVDQMSEDGSESSATPSTPASPRQALADNRSPTTTSRALLRQTSRQGLISNPKS